MMLPKTVLISFGTLTNLYANYSSEYKMYTECFLSTGIRCEGVLYLTERASFPRTAGPTTRSATPKLLTFTHRVIIMNDNKCSMLKRIIYILDTRRHMITYDSFFFCFFFYLFGDKMLYHQRMLQESLYGQDVDSGT